MIIGEFYGFVSVLRKRCEFAKDLFRMLCRRPLWRRGLCLFLGGVSALCLPPFSLFPILWISFPLFISILDSILLSENRDFREKTLLKKGRGSCFSRLCAGADVGWYFGFGYFLGGFWWIGQAFFVIGEGSLLFQGSLAVFAVTLLCGTLALSWAGALALAACFWNQSWTRLLVFAFALSGAEWGRGSLLGFGLAFPWNLLGYSLAQTALFLQSVSLIGINGLTAFSILFFSAPLLLIPHQDEPSRSQYGRFCALFLLSCVTLLLLAYGRERLRSPLALRKDVQLVLIQPSISQEEKLRPHTLLPILDELLTLSQKALQSLKSSSSSPETKTYLIWPETALPLFLNRTGLPETVLAPFLPDSVTLLTGAFYRETLPPDHKGKNPVRDYNALYAISGQGQILGLYFKRLLVPWGEYLPFRHLLGIFEKTLPFTQNGEFSPGPLMSEPLLPEGPSVIPLICYEAIFPIDRQKETSLSPEMRKEWILNLVNDAWFGTTPGPLQHLMHARIRAVSEGLPLVRSTNTGISAVIDPYGRLIAQTTLLEKTALITFLPKALSNAPIN